MLHPIDGLNFAYPSGSDGRTALISGKSLKKALPYGESEITSFIRAEILR